MGILSYKTIPTVDLYFKLAMDDLILRRRLGRFERIVYGGSEAAFIRRLGPFSFYGNGVVVILRYITPKELKIIKNLPAKKTVYVIDDNLFALQGDASLPIDYREKLLRFKEGDHLLLRASADVIVAPNEHILENYPDTECYLLHPIYVSLAKEPACRNGQGKIHIVYSGTRSHVQDLEFIAPGLLKLLERNQHVTLTTYLGTYAPRQLRGVERVRHCSPCTWRRFKKILQNERYDIAIAPLVETKFNEGRSINKLYEAAAFGAAGVYSHRAPISQFITHDKTGLLVQGGAEQWYEVLNELANDKSKISSLAKSCVEYCNSLDANASQREFWLSLLGL